MIAKTHYKNWYHNLNPHKGHFQDSHVIAHLKADTITYEEPTIPSELRIEPRTESRAIHILCIHHKGTPTRSEGYTQQMYNIVNALQLPAMFTQSAPPTPQDTPVNCSIKWSKLTYPPHPPTTQTPNIPLITNIDRCLPLKYLAQLCYYTY